MSSARSAAAITANIAWAYLDADLYALAQHEPSRTALRETLLVAWFADRRSRLLPVLADERGSDRYQWQLRDSAAGKYIVPADIPPELALAGKTLMLPKEKGLWPKREALEWRVGRLLGR